MNTPLWLLLTALAASPEPPAGWVQLPLAEYHDLVERGQRVRPPEPAAEARVSAEHVALRLDGDQAHLDAQYDFEFAGARPPSYDLAFLAVPERVTVTPADAAAVGRNSADGLRITPVRPGRVTLRVEAHQALDVLPFGAASLALVPASGSVAELVLDLPAQLGWLVPGTTVAEDRVTGDRRRIRLARQAGVEGNVEVHGKVAAREEAPAYVRGVTVTMIEPGPDTINRTDVVLYEVQRGFLGEFAVRLPAGYEPDPVATTDEGPASFDLAAGRLVIQRQSRLAGRGHLLLTASPPWPASGAPLRLPALDPEVEVRSRFLVVTASLAAEWSPQPAGAWTRVDREDLPPTLREAVQGLALAAVWRLAAGAPASDLALGIETLPPVALAQGLVPQRRTVTVATVEGSLVHRDEIAVESGPAALELVLPAGMEFWSAKVNGAPTRPVEAQGVHRIPLPLGRGQRHTVEVVTAEKRTLPAGKAKENVRFELPLVRGSVVRHEWRLMLPENRDYRLVGGDLRAVPPSPPPPPPPPPRPEAAAEVELRDERKLRHGSTVSQVELDQVPTARDPWVILEKTPGVQLDRVNVGGNESGQQSTFLGPLPVQARVPETGKAVLLSGALPPPTVTVTIESRPLKKRRR